MRANEYMSFSAGIARARFSGIEFDASSGVNCNQDGERKEVLRLLHGEK